MNLIDAVVTKVKAYRAAGTPDKKLKWYEVDVDYEDDAGCFSKTLQFDTKIEALAVVAGYVFQN